MSDIYEVRIKGLTLDPMTNMPIVILTDVEGSRSLPIWIGIFEANAIALEMEKVETPRPMTHDLMMNIMEALRARILRVVVHDLRENTFFATIVLQTGDGEMEIDSRPSDAIALAIRCQAPIFVTRDVMERSQTLEVDEELYDREKLRKWLDNIKPEDFGKSNA